MMKEYNINHTTLKILGLYRSHYKRSIHLRQIARETNVDVKAVQLQLQRLETMNIVASALKGKNKEYSLNMSNPIAKHYIVLAETFMTISFLGKNFLVKKIVSEISDKVEGIIILFGSFAKGGAGKESDIDLLIVSNGKLGAMPKSAIREASDIIDRDIAVKSANKRRLLNGLQNGEPLFREVVSNHIVLKGVDEFCDILWRHYAKQ